jgi:hypothetical protein
MRTNMAMVKFQINQLNRARLSFDLMMSLSLITHVGHDDNDVVVVVVVVDDDDDDKMNIQ